MATPQTILTRKTKYALFLVLTINDGGEEAVRDFLPDFAGLISAVSSRAPDQALAGIVGIASDAWDRLFDGPRPRLLRPFTPLEGPVHSAPATSGDLLLHLKSDQFDLCYELGRKATGALGDAVTVVEEVHGFRYFDLRDLIGFVDGTENPTGQDAIDAITVGDEDSYFAGGSYVATQRYVTDFADWESLTVEEQEAAIGRTKLDNIEMSDAVKPANSHIALNVIEDADGNEIDVVRDNMPYGDASVSGETGTFYIAYSAGPDVTDAMLRNMFLGDPPGNYDRLLDFTTAVSGVQFFAPTTDFLAAPPPAPTAAGTVDDETEDSGAAPTPTETPVEPTPEAAPPTRTRPADGSLGIGSLH